MGVLGGGMPGSSDSHRGRLALARVAVDREGGRRPSTGGRPDFGLRRFGGRAGAGSPRTGLAGRQSLPGGTSTVGAGAHRNGGEHARRGPAWPNLSAGCSIRPPVIPPPVC